MMMKRVSYRLSEKWIVIIFLALAAFFETPSDATATVLPFEDVPCKNKVVATLKGWRSVNDWSPTAPDSDLKQLFQTPTRDIGTWIQIKMNADGDTIAKRVTRHTTLTVNWSKAANCEAKSTMQLTPFNSDSRLSDFTDSSLSFRIKNESEGGALLLWSPHMQYSIEAVKNAQKAAEATGIKLDLLLDSKADMTLAIEDAKKLGISILRNESLELQMRGAELHFPTLVVYAHGAIAPILPGLGSPALYEKYIREHTK